MANLHGFRSERRRIRGGIFDRRFELAGVLFYIPKIPKDLAFVSRMAGAIVFPRERFATRPAMGRISTLHNRSAIRFGAPLRR